MHDTLTPAAIRADMRRVEQSCGGASAAAALAGVAAAGWTNIMRENFNPGARLIDALYLPGTGTIRPELLAGGTPAPEAAPASHAHPITAAALLEKAQARADALEAELDDLTGAIETLRGLMDSLA